MSDYYYLKEDHSYDPCDLPTWSNQFEELSRAGKRKVAHDIVEGLRVSTVWLGLDHNFLRIGGKPHLFETMIFDDDGDYGWDYDYQERYTTWNEAVEGHKKAIEWIKNARK